MYDSTIQLHKYCVLDQGTPELPSIISQLHTGELRLIFKDLRLHDSCRLYEQGLSAHHGQNPSHLQGEQIVTYFEHLLEPKCSHDAYYFLAKLRGGGTVPDPNSSYIQANKVLVSVLTREISLGDLQAAGFFGLYFPPEYSFHSKNSALHSWMKSYR